MAQMTRRQGTVPRVIVALIALVALIAAGGCFGGNAESEASPEASPGDGAQSTTTVEPTSEPTNARWPEIGVARITTDDLNVRTGPGTQHVVVGRLQPGDEVPVSGHAPGSSWLALPGLGWVSYEDEWFDLSVEVTDLPEIPLSDAAYEFVGPLHPPGTDVGLPVVNEVVNAMVQGDRSSLLRMVSSPEANPEGQQDSGDSGDSESSEGAGELDIPAHPCPDTVLPATELHEHLDEFLTSEVAGDDAGDLRLYAVIGAPGDEDVDPEFVTVFAFEQGEGRQVWIAPDGSGIRWFSMGCGPMVPGDMLQLTNAEPFFWFRPVAPEPLDPVS